MLIPTCLSFLGQKVETQFFVAVDSGCLCSLFLTLTYVGPLGPESLLISPVAPRDV